MPPPNDRFNRLDPSALYRPGDLETIDRISNLANHIIDAPRQNSDNRVSGNIFESEKQTPTTKSPLKNITPIYTVCPSCENARFVELNSEITSSITCERCHTKFQVVGTWKPSEIMFLEIKNEIVVPYLCLPKPQPNSKPYFIIWNFISRVWPDVTNFVKFGFFRYYTPTQFSAIVTNDPEIIAFEPNIDKATKALMSKLRSYEDKQQIISPQPEDIGNCVQEFILEMNEFVSKKDTSDKTIKVPQTTNAQGSVIGDLDPNMPAF